jgi:cytochrome P450
VNRTELPRTCTLRQSLAFLRDPAHFIGGAGLSLGDLYRVRVPGARLLVVTDAELLEGILVRDADSFVKSRLYWRALRHAFGDSMASMDGDDWQYLHRHQRPFFTRRAVAGYLPAIAAGCLNYFDRLEDRVAVEPEIPMLETLAELNARLTLAVLFGQHDDPEAESVSRRIAEGHEIIAWITRFPWRVSTVALSRRGRRAAEHRAFFTEFARRLEVSAAGGEPETLLQALIAIGKSPQAGRYPASLLRNEVVFHLGASTETQAAVEGWALYLLWKHPEVLERVRAELEAVAGRRPVGPDQLGELPYTRQVLQEALRLYPPVYGVVRDCVRPVDVGAYRARPGDAFLLSVIGLHRSPRYWDAPEEFRPERFGPGGSAPAAKHQFVPFGAGKHVCIGQHLAMPTMLLTLAMFLQRFDWAFIEPEAVPEARPSLKPAGAFRATVSLRL